MPIYEAFEGILRRDDVGDVGGLKEGEGEGDGSDGEMDRVWKSLRGLRMDRLLRASRLRSDVLNIGSKAGGRRPDTELLKRRPRLQAFVAHVRSAAKGKPHLLMAYMWVLYMALFSGGRYIRARLRGAGGEFWSGGDEEGTADRYLTFWSFEGGEDGEDLKAEFKDRFASVEERLTEGEKDEVVGEAVFIMRAVEGVVGEVAEVIGQGAEGQPGMRWLLLKHVLPMGMVELMEAVGRGAVGVGVGVSAWRARGR